MPDKYLYETFSYGSSEFDRRFTDYLNEKWTDNWKVKHCDFSYGTDEKSASCLFKQRA